MDRKTSNGLIMRIEPQPNGLRRRILGDPKTQTVVADDQIGPGSLRSKAVNRRKRF